MVITSGALLGAAGIAAAASAAGAGANVFSNWLANNKNAALNEENLAFQRQTFEYQKALQQQIFEREDTAYQRAAADAQQVGINPMALAGSGGASAGQAIDVTTPQNNMQYRPNLEGVDFGNALTAGLTAVENLNALATGQKERDLLQSQIDNNRFQTLLSAMSNGFEYNPKSKSFVYNLDSKTIHPQFEILKNQARDTGATASRNERVNDYQSTYGSNDTTPMPILLATETSNQSNRFLSGLGQIGNSVKGSVEGAWNNYKSSPYANLVDKALNDVGAALSNGYSKVSESINSIVNKAGKYLNKGKNNKSATKGNMR